MYIYIGRHYYTYLYICIKTYTIIGMHSPGREVFHEPINFLSLPRQSEGRQVSPQCLGGGGGGGAWWCVVGGGASG